MPEQNDHDLLVRLDAKVEMIMTTLSSSIQSNTAITKELAERVARLEIKDRGDSEKVQSITVDVQRSLNNAAKIDTLTADQNALRDDIRELKAKSNLWDIGNSIAVAIAAALGFFGK